MFKFVTRTALGLCAAAAVSLGAWAQDLTIGLGADVTSIDPHFLNLSPNNNIAEHVFDKLVQMDAEAAADARASRRRGRRSTTTTWEFKLRQGVKFHDGSELTAEDVAFSIDRVAADPEQPVLVRRSTRSAITGDDHRRPVHDPLQDRRRRIR